MIQAESACVEAGFQTTVFPISAGDVVRLAPIAVKLNGLIAKHEALERRGTPAGSRRPADEIGCSS